MYPEVLHPNFFEFLFLRERYFHFDHLSLLLCFFVFCREPGQLRFNLFMAEYFIVLSEFGYGIGVNC